MDETETELETMTLEFCAHCGVLLPDDLSDVGEPHCANCGGDVSAVEYRCSGEFPLADGQRLITLLNEG